MELEWEFEQLELEARQYRAGAWLAKTYPDHYQWESARHVSGLNYGHLDGMVEEVRLKETNSGEYLTPWLLQERAIQRLNRGG
jgi:hypothetical protein